MIGDGWDGDPAIRPGEFDRPDPRREHRPPRRRIAVVTGSRAEFGLLEPVMRAVQRHPDLELLCIAAGSHLVQPGETFRDVKAAFPIADSVPMQIAGRTGHYEDAESVSRGVGRFARSFQRLNPNWVVVLGDRIEAFAAAIAAGIGGFALAHIHGGDRAEGVADESIRHAISKLAHLHLAATPCSAERLVRMGEKPTSVHITGSPAIDGLGDIPSLDDEAFAALGSPTTVFLFHPVGRHPEVEEAAASTILEAICDPSPAGGGPSATTAQHTRLLCLHPNFDPGRDGILRAIALAGVETRSHLPRRSFVGLLKRLASSPERGVLVGNSSAALIESAALRLAAVDIGNRQTGRERANNCVHSVESVDAVRHAIRHARSLDPATFTHPYGDGRAGERIAELLAATDPTDPALRRKLCTY